MSNRWIKCGLPWTNHGNWDKTPAPPNLNKEEKKEFGKTTEQAYKELYALLGGATYGTPAYEKIVKSKEYKTAQKKYKNFADKVRAWMQNQPAWIDYQEVLKAWSDCESQKSFCGKGLNKPGTLVEVLDNKELKQHLIGDINTLGGVCDDCMGFSKDAVVVRYKVLGDW